MRILERLNLTQVYEHAAVYFNDCAFGGMNNTDIPNFVYRWTEREVEKTIQTYAPYCQHQYIYKYGTAFPCTPELESKGGVKKLVLTIARPLYWLFIKLFPKQQNLFAFFIEKPSYKENLFPWLRFDNKEGKAKFNRSWETQDTRIREPSRKTREIQAVPWYKSSHSCAFLSTARTMHRS